MVRPFAYEPLKRFLIVRILLFSKGIALSVSQPPQVRVNQSILFCVSAVETN